MKLSLRHHAANPLLYKPKRFTTVVMLLIVFAGGLGSLFAGITARTLTRDSLMSRAVTTADALNVKEIESLKGSDMDVKSVAYQDIKHRLSQIKSDNPDLRFVYLLGNRGSDIYFMVDSESPASNLYSAPGEAYPEASGEIKGSFVVSKAFIEGPLSSNGREWLSALVPVVDNSTGNTVALLGIDLPVYGYYRQIFIYSLIPLLLAAIPFAGLLRDRELQRKEQEISQLKTQFVSVASHELRSPLAGVLWATQTLIKPGSNKNITEEQHGLLVDVYSSTALSLATVNEILDFSIFDRNNAMKLQHERINLFTVLKEVEKILKLSAKEADVQIKFADKWPETIEVSGDVAALKRAFTNIITNAVKYSPAGKKIELVYSSEHDEHVIAVRDHGIGIPRTEQKRVLEGYYRATNATKFQTRGTGLGLWITRLIIEQHGGRLWIKSKEGEGTIVFAALPKFEISPKLP